MMAIQLLDKDYAGRGRTIQFHPNTTYENFIGGLAPVNTTGEFGFRFTPVPGFLMEAATQAIKDPSRKYLLHIDEINRADLGKILGEAIFLLEATADGDRKIDLPMTSASHFIERFLCQRTSTFWVR
jgi:5-methylcytosine-specific restriction protein B